jgi:hypothetical protein
MVNEYLIGRRLPLNVCLRHGFSRSATQKLDDVHQFDIQKINVVDVAVAGKIVVKEEEKGEHRNHIRRRNGGNGCTRLLAEHGRPVGMAASGSRGMLGLDDLRDTAGACGGGGLPMSPPQRLSSPSAEPHERVLRLPHIRNCAMSSDQLFFGKKDFGNILLKEILLLQTHRSQNDVLEIQLPNWIVQGDHMGMTIIIPHHSSTRGKSQQNDFRTVPSNSHFGPPRSHITMQPTTKASNVCRDAVSALSAISNCDSHASFKCFMIL